jgi:vesicle-fusing ATPase
MTVIAATPQPMLLNPDLAVPDLSASWWLAQATLRLRREVAWCWHLRGEGKQTTTGALPPFADAAVESLDLARYADDKRYFMANDVTARHLGERMTQYPRPPRPDGVAGGWNWLQQNAGLDDASQFVLALAFAARLDAALGPVFACCQNDSARPYPTLALAQRLWDEPRAIAACADPGHPLRRFGLLTASADGREAIDWLQPLDMAATLVEALADPQGFVPTVLAPMAGDGRALPEAAHGLLAHLEATPPQALQLVPLAGSRGTDYAAWAAALATHGGRRVVRLAASVPPDRVHVPSLLALCWLRGVDLLVPDHWQERAAAHASEPWFAAMLMLPVRCYVPAPEPGTGNLPSNHVTPSFRVPPLGFAARVAQLEAALGPRAPSIGSAVREAARRFRLDEVPLQQVARALAAQRGPVSPAQLDALCRTGSATGTAGLVQAVEPRFTLEELVLPRQQARHMAEIVQAMRSLTRVHYEWGTARAWNESGLAVLFCGASGTGKTMAAEALAHALALPLYRIDLSQVVNKYIGETEKNLAKIFDAAEASDSILLFDEADALFGKRTDVKDAHDRFANIEISYLLERMERFKGLAILATNRRKDLDEAFTRRLRYVVEFPLPGPTERERIWRQVIPSVIDSAGLDFRFLASQFDLSGGHIRSAAFNACLQCAGTGGGARLAMPEVLTAVRRELDKLGRLAEPEQFGRYAHLVRNDS